MSATDFQLEQIHSRSSILSGGYSLYVATHTWMIASFVWQFLSLHWCVIVRDRARRRMCTPNPPKRLTLRANEHTSHFEYICISQYVYLQSNVEQR